MDLETAVKGMMDAKARLQSKAAVTSPSILSEQMYRLGQYTSAIEDHLADLEEDYEKQEAAILKRELHPEGFEAKRNSATGAGVEVKIELGELEGQIKRLDRVVKASWKQGNTAMARYNHLLNEMKGAV
jgi:chromosome segregation ATPase